MNQKEVTYFNKIILERIQEEEEAHIKQQNNK